MKVDPVLERYGPRPSIPMTPWMLDARRRVVEQSGHLLGIADDQLDRRWLWRDDAGGDTEVRYVFYRALETLERAAGLAAAAVAHAGPPPAASRPFALATMARWDMHGLLAALADADLDADPGGGEWTIRQTLAHLVNVQRAYPAYSAWWLSLQPNADPPVPVPDEVGEGFPEEADDGAGSLVEIGQRLDAVMDGAAERMAALDDAGLRTPARWSGLAVDVGFRLGRMSSHLQEHTVQVEKTLVMLDRMPSEVERLVRLVHRAYGRLEATVYALRPELSEVGREPFTAAIDEMGDVVDHVRRPESVSDFPVE